MKKLHSDILELVDEEYDRAAEKYGAATNSMHESYAILLEEYEEARDEDYKFIEQLELLWYNIKNNNNETAHEQLPKMLEIAIEAASEWVQTAAMCYKAMQIGQIGQIGQKKTCCESVKDGADDC